MDSVRLCHLELWILNWILTQSMNAKSYEISILILQGVSGKKTFQTGISIVILSSNNATRVISWFLTKYTVILTEDNYHLTLPTL